MRFLLLFFLTACSSTASRQFADGVPVRAPIADPRPGYAPAGAGLPEYWGSPAEPELPRTPHSRVLPETPETRRGPGVWAGDEPKTSAKPAPEIAGIPIVLPPTREDPAPVVDMGCTESVNNLLSEFKLMDDLLSVVRDGHRQCIVARLYSICIETSGEARRVRHEKHQDLLRKRKLPTVAYTKSGRQKADEQAAQRFIDSACSPPNDVSRTVYVDQVGDALKRAALRGL